MYWRHIPNLLTCLRIALVIPIVIALLQRHYELAFYLFFLAGCTDALDGLLARVNNWTSRFGAIADPLADKLLLMASFLALAWLGEIPVWLVAIVILRDLWIVLGGYAYHKFIGYVDIQPSNISKINTCLQLLLVLLWLIDLSFIQLSPRVMHALTCLVSVTCVLSFVHYTYLWGTRAINARQLPIAKKNLDRTQRGAA